MKIIKAIGAGSMRSFKAWKAILIIWFSSLLIVTLLAIPLKSALIDGFGNSMITENFRDGIDMDAFADLGDILSSTYSSFSSGMGLLIVCGILVNAFFTGGTFYVLNGSESKISVSDFFRASAKYFWSFFCITLVISVVIILLALTAFSASVTAITYTESGAGKAPVVASIIAGTVFLFALILFLLVADYARAWLIREDRQVCFRSLGFGFSETFSTILSSFPMMLFISAVQVLFIRLVILILGRWRPDTGGGVFLLFIISQVLYMIRILLKAWRYGSVTSLMEMNHKNNFQ